MHQEAWIENRPTVGVRSLNLAELWQYRELAAFLALRDLKVRYKQAVFGAAWALLQPLAGVVVFTFVFRRLGGVPSDGIPLPVFIFVGLSVWTYLSGAVQKGTQSLVANSALVTKVYFPRLLAPLSAALPGVVDLTLSLLLLGVFIPLYDVPVGWAIVTLPLWYLTLLAVAFGAGLLLGTLNVSYRDVNHAINLLLQLWLFISPALYSSSVVENRLVYSMNPVAGVLEGFRWALLGGPWPGRYLLVSLASTVVLLIISLVYFQRSERRFADVI
jgi:ABC-type polysaccharide/polyol phosphate export permease